MNQFYGCMVVCISGIFFILKIYVHLEKILKNGFLGDAPNDHNAIKSGGHEVRGLMNVASTNVPGLHFPLMVTHYQKIY